MRAGALVAAITLCACTAAAFGHDDGTAPARDAGRTGVIRAYERGDYAEVIERCTASLALEAGPDARALYTHYLAAAHHALSEPGRAIALWTRVHEQWPDSPFAARALLGIALAHASLGDWAGCEAACNRYLLSAQPGSRMLVAQYWRAEALAQQGRWLDAADAFRRVLADPAEHALQVDARLGLAHCMAELGHVREAFRLTDEVEDVAPHHPDRAAAWLRVAQAAANGADQAQAQEAARRAVAADPAFAVDGALAVATAALTEGRAQDAGRALRPLLAESTRPTVYARILATLAWTAFAQGDYTRAVAFYEQAERVLPGAIGPRGRLRLGLSYLTLNDHAAAVEALAQLQGEPALGALADTLDLALAEASLRSDAPVAAKHLLGVGLRERPDSPYSAWRHERLARLESARGEWTAAGEAYRAAAATADGDVAALLQWRAAYADARHGDWARVEAQLAGGPQALPAAQAARFAALAGDAAAAQGAWTRAAAQYRFAAAVAPDPGGAAALWARAVRAAAVGGDVAALTSLASDASATPARAEALLWLGALAHERGNVPQARTAWEEAGDLTGSAADRARFALAWDYLNAGQYDQAGARLARQRSFGALAPWAQYGLALVRLHQSAYRVAAADFLRLAQEYAGSRLADDAAVRAGEALNGGGAWREAEDAFLSAARTAADPDMRRHAQFGIGWTLAARGFEADAAAAFRAGLALRADDRHAAQALAWLGQYNIAAGRYAAAADDLSAALQLELPQAAVAEYWLARTLWERGQYVAAAATFAGCRHRPGAAPFEPLLAYWEVRCAVKLGDDAAVLANVETLRKTFPVTGSWLDLDLAQADAHRRRGEWEAALRAYDRVAAGDPGRAGARATIDGAACLAAMGDRDGAIVRLFRIRPGEHPPGTVAEARVALGALLVHAGRARDAKHLLMDVVRQYPHTDAARMAQAALDGLAAPT